MRTDSVQREQQRAADLEQLRADLEQREQQRAADLLQLRADMQNILSIIKKDN